MRVLSSRNLVGAALFVGLLPMLGVAQQERGDREIGLAGAATISNTSPVFGQVFAEASFGKYLSSNQYLGVVAAPLFTFGGGGTSGGVSSGGEYRYLFGGRKTNRIWPFVGAQAAYGYLRAGGVSQHTGIIAPEFGLKFYVSQKTAFEVSYLLQTQFGAGPYDGFGSRSNNFVVFGFKHIF